MNNNNYFVYGNLNHNGVLYKRGDTIELSDEFAPGLLEAGVIGTEEVQATVPPAPVVEEKPQSSEVAAAGGAPLETGESSIDGAAAPAGEAVDVTPLVDMKRGDLEELAVKEGLDAAEVSKLPNKPAVIALIEKHREAAVAPAGEVEVQEDISANL
jgi:hypothetical protein